MKSMYTFYLYDPIALNKSPLLDLTHLQAHKYIEICLFQNIFGFHHIGDLYHSQIMDMTTLW